MKWNSNRNSECIGGGGCRLVTAISRIFQFTSPTRGSDKRRTEFAFLIDSPRSIIRNPLLTAVACLPCVFYLPDRVRFCDPTEAQRALRMCGGATKPTFLNIIKSSFTQSCEPADEEARGIASPSLLRTHFVLIGLQRQQPALQNHSTVLLAAVFCVV